MQATFVKRPPPIFRTPNVACKQAPTLDPAPTFDPHSPAALHPRLPHDNFLRMPSAETAVFKYRQAGVDDAEIVLTLMRDFYAEEHLVFDETATKRALHELLASAESTSASPALASAVSAASATPSDSAKTSASASALTSAKIPALGVIFLFENAGSVVGHATVTFGFSLEFHGRFALLDELYLIPSARGHGWGRTALETVATYARTHEIATLRLEINRANAHARSIYLKAGFNDDQRDLLTHWLR